MVRETQRDAIIHLTAFCNSLAIEVKSLKELVATLESELLDLKDGEPDGLNSGEEEVEPSPVRGRRIRKDRTLMEYHRDRILGFLQTHWQMVEPMIAKSQSSDEFMKNLILEFDPEKNLNDSDLQMALDRIDKAWKFAKGSDRYFGAPN